jgi:hypothetical protein
MSECADPVGDFKSHVRASGGSGLVPAVAVELFVFRREIWEISRAMTIKTELMREVPR